MKKALLLIISSLYFSCAVAQVTVEAAIDSIEMLIGEQVHVTVTATMKEMENSCNRYVKTLRLKVNSEGKFEIEIQK